GGSARRRRRARRGARRAAAGRRRAAARIAAAALACAVACVPSPEPVRRASPDLAALDRAVRAALDPSADPCADFHQFACGGWLAAVPPPTDRPQVMRAFSSIDARNRTLLVRVLERETDRSEERRVGKERG